jgi:hypothetical protein
MTAAAKALRPRQAAAAILASGWAVMLAMTVPGQASFDTVRQLADGRSGHYDSWHPPVMAFLLGLLDRIVPGTLLFQIAMSAMALAALLWLLWLKPPPRWSVAAVALGVMLTPQWLLYQSDLWKDVLFANAAVAGFAALARAADNWPSRGLWLTAALLLLSVAAMARQNGVVLLPVAAVTLGLIAARHMPGAKAAGYGAGFLGLLLITTFGVNGLLIAHGDGGKGASLEIRYAQGYDLVGALRKNPALPLPALHATDPKLETLLRTRGVAHYSARLIDAYANDPQLSAAIERSPKGAIFAAWRELVLHHPGLYMAQRLPVFWQVLATPDIRACHPMFFGVDGPVDVLKRLGLARRWTMRDGMMARYGTALLDTPLFSHLAFAALAVFLLIILLRRGDSADIAIAGLLAGALFFAFTFLVVSVACDYRYLYFLDLAGLTGAFYISRRFTFS